MASGGGPHRPPSSRRPHSISKDEAFARQLQEEEEAARIQEDEEMARRMHRDLNRPVIGLSRPEGRPPLRTMTPLTQLFSSLVQHSMRGRNISGSQTDSEDEENNSDDSDSTLEENVPPRSTQGPPTVRGSQGSRGRGRGGRRSTHGMRPSETDIITPTPTSTSSTEPTTDTGSTPTTGSTSTPTVSSTTTTTTPARRGAAASRGRGRGTRPRHSRGRGRGGVTVAPAVPTTPFSNPSSNDEESGERTASNPQPPRSMEASVPPLSLALNRPELPRGETEPEILLVDRGTSNSDARFIHIMRDPMLLILFLMGRRPDLLVPDDVDPNDYESLWELAERIGEVKNRGMEDKELKQLPTKRFTSQKKVFTDDHEGPQCRVCLSSYKNGDNLCALPCKHDFHAACVKEWLKRNASCPICRHDLKK